MYGNVFARRGQSVAVASIGLTLLLVPMLPASAFGQMAAGDPRLDIDPTAPLLAESSKESSITLGLEISRTDAARPTLDLRGHRTTPGNSGTFKVGANISRIPCPGEYRFEAAQENTGNGNSATYTALVKLFDPSSHPPGARCGVSPPPLPGRVSVSLATLDSELFVLHGTRRSAGQFKGTLSFVSFLECGRAYRLETALDLAGWNRSFDFGLRVVEVNATLQGKKLPDERC